MINKVTLIGRVGQDPSFNTFQDGTRVANFSVATNESWKDKATGEKKTTTDWHRVSVINKGLIPFVESFITKGVMIYIEGSLKTREYKDNQGVTKYLTEISIRPYSGDIKLLTWPDHVDNEKYEQTAKTNSKVITDSEGEVLFVDDEIPF